MFKKNRLLVLEALYRCSNEDIHGCDLAKSLNLSKSLLSYHISYLVREGLVVESVSGRKKIYVINNNKKNDVVKILKAVSLID